MMTAPQEPSASRYEMPDPTEAPAHGLVAMGGDLAPGTILAAYRRGIFPWPDQSGNLLWWSPDPRAILPLGGFHASRRLRRLQRQGRFRVTWNEAFGSVVRGCAARHEGTWITLGMAVAYERLHELGWAHSIEAWCGTTLAGGLYGVAIGGFFAAESMFHRASNASKIALLALVERLRARGFSVLDVQFRTPHLTSLGAIEIPRTEYLRRLRLALEQPVTP